MNEAQSKPAPVKKHQNAIVNESFVANFFSGKIESSQIFPYPNNMNSEQTEMLQMIVEPFKKFFSVCKYSIIFIIVLVIIF